MLYYSSIDRMFLEVKRSQCIVVFILFVQGNQNQSYIALKKPEVMSNLERF